jgi:hypothetical protein
MIFITTDSISIVVLVELSQGVMLDIVELK